MSVSYVLECFIEILVHIMYIPPTHIHTATRRKKPSCSLFKIQGLLAILAGFHWQLQNLAEGSQHLIKY